MRAGRAGLRAYRQDARRVCRGKDHKAGQRQHRRRCDASLRRKAAGRRVRRLFLRRDVHVHRRRLDEARGSVRPDGRDAAAVHPDGAGRLSGRASGHALPHPPRNQAHQGHGCRRAPACARQSLRPRADRLPERGDGGACRGLQQHGRVRPEFGNHPAGVRRQRQPRAENAHDHDRRLPRRDTRRHHSPGKAPRLYGAGFHGGAPPVPPRAQYA